MGVKKLLNEQNLTDKIARSTVYLTGRVTSTGACSNREASAFETSWQPHETKILLAAAYSMEVHPDSPHSDG